MPGLSPGRLSAVLFLDRQAEPVRSICARQAPVGDFSRARQSLDRMRAGGGRVGVASHNRADGWGGFDTTEIEAMHGRLEATLGSIDLWCVCLVDAGGDCACRVPASGLFVAGAEAAGLAVDDCTVVAGDGRLRRSAEQTGAVRVLRPAGDDAAEAVVRAVDAVIG